ncbi:MAG TPA: response regulator transcription factor [Verrucomicrobiae bacterium]|jgi:two-component system copper resistance phosphate regulon response regulator CusR|nr:response regulator transcription factor [Verrucomicrobiae bacterium]
MRILVLEDEKKVAEFVACGLRDHRFAVDISNDGQSGWEMAKTFDYDLIILDLMLPGLSGTEVLKRIRQHDSKTPILILTAHASTSEKVTHFEAGADDYLSKPFAFEELLMRVKALIRRGGTEPLDVLRIGDLEIDRASRQVKRGGRKIELTTKEYSLLEYLSANAGRVTTRTMIIEHVWDESFQGLTNIVDVYVRHLRSKVDDDSPKKLIRTVRGVGYAISDETED